MGKFEDSRTYQNLMTAFAGESQARNKYTYWASAAKKEGYEQIMGFFLETADNEMEHAKRFAKFLGLIGCTTDNLKHAAEGEKFEYTSMYPEFAKVAKEEGYEDIAAVFSEIGEVEEAHEKRYLKLLKNIEDSSVFKKDKPVFWKCRNCGYLHYGMEAPDKCPACAHPRSYYEVLCENY